jgi:serine/threonine protein phosphatase PrpC
LEILYNGTTAVTCYITKVMEKDKPVKKLFTANVGDARVVISRGGKAYRLTHDHKASDEEETKRITNSGGFVAYNRVNGILSVTRALGDHAMKEWVVSDPHYSEIVLNDKDEYLILACDGIWDVLTDQDAVDLIKDETNAQVMCEKLMKTALSKGSTDNIYVMVLIF